MMMNKELEPKSYWEKRSRLNEIFMEHMFGLIYGTLGGYEASVAKEIQKVYFEAINELVDEYEADMNEVK